MLVRASQTPTFLWGKWGYSEEGKKDPTVGFLEGVSEALILYMEYQPFVPST